MALFPSILLPSLVAIGTNKRNRFRCQATGFLVGFQANNPKDHRKRQYWVFLVTNRHVFQNSQTVDLRLNLKTGKSKVFTEQLVNANGQQWFSHANTSVDLALLPISPATLNQHNVKWDFIPDDFFAPLKSWDKIGIDVGDGLYLAGFPLGIAGELQNAACVRHGVISRADKELLKSHHFYLADASVFPGNSGGPVFLEPAALKLQNTTAVSKSYLIGVVSGYLPYEEILYTHQTTPPTAGNISRENSGLATIVPLERMTQIYRQWHKQNKPQLPRLKTLPKPS